jgi:hypothetical protein
MNPKRFLTLIAVLMLSSALVTATMAAADYS